MPRDHLHHAGALRGTRRLPERAVCSGRRRSSRKRAARKKERLRGAAGSSSIAGWCPTSSRLVQRLVVVLAALVLTRSEGLCRPVHQFGAIGVLRVAGRLAQGARLSAPRSTVTLLVLDIGEATDASPAALRVIVMLDTIMAHRGQRAVPLSVGLADAQRPRYREPHAARVVCADGRRRARRCCRSAGRMQLDGSTKTVSASAVR